MLKEFACITGFSFELNECRIFIDFKEIDLKLNNADTLTFFLLLIIILQNLDVEPVLFRILLDLHLLHLIISQVV